MIYRQAGETSAQALAAIKARHGDDVIVIATHETAQGVEVVFTVEADPVVAPSFPSAADASAQPVNARRAPAAGSVNAGARHAASASAAASRTATGVQTGDDLPAWLAADAHRASVWQDLNTAGFSASLSRALLDSLPQSPRPEVVMRQALESLQQHLQTACEASEIVDQGGVHALVGPTGSGKTTTVAKLAVRCLAAHGKGSVCIVTTDTYRIGAVDQLRIYGRVLGVNVLVANSADALRTLLKEQSGVHLTLIDTMGLSHRDPRVSSLVSGFDELGVRKWLVLSAASQPGVQRDVIRRFEGSGYAGCILTKLDESVELGGTLDAVLRHGLALPYVSVGQRVPEDLHRADPVFLAWQAMPDAMSGSFRLDDWLSRWQRWGLLPEAGREPGEGEVTL